MTIRPKIYFLCTFTEKHLSSVDLMEKVKKRWEKSLQKYNSEFINILINTFSLCSPNNKSYAWQSLLMSFIIKYTTMKKHKIILPIKE